MYEKQTSNWARECVYEFCYQLKSILLLILFAAESNRKITVIHLLLKVSLYCARARHSQCIICYHKTKNINQRWPHIGRNLSTR